MGYILGALGVGLMMVVGILATLVYVLQRETTFTGPADEQDQTDEENLW